ncbi:DUF3558 domain-containing protein [Arthrobacter sp. SLBN-53]|nr:DUF3558 domain-containing protein [Arthrobacter sp. SLBN-53]
MIFRRGDARLSCAAKMLVVATAVLPVVVACSDSESPSTPSVPSTTESAPEAQHGPVFPECGGISDETIAQLTQVRGLVNTARTSVGCQWLVGGGIIGPHFSFTHFRGSPMGRERKTMELSRASVEDVSIEGHDGFVGIGEDLVLGRNLCEVGIGFGDDFIEWSVSYTQKPFPDACEVAKELTRQSIVNAQR